MQKIIDEILEAEGKAEKLILEARKKAKELKSDIEKENNTKIAEAQEKAQEIIRNGVSHAQKETDVEYMNTIKQTEINNANFRKDNSENREKTVKRIIELIIKPEHEKE